MHAVVIRVAIKDQKAEELVREQVVPRVSKAPGFVAGYWTKRGTDGLSMLVFDSEDMAQAVARKIHAADADSTTVEGVEVREVIAHA